MATAIPVPPALPETGKVLFVDDEENILRSLERLFMDENVEVFIAASGKAGLKRLGEHPDMAVIVSDQRMPEMTGVDFLEKAREVAPGAVRILFTGYADVNAAIDAVNRGGIFRYLSKPWNDEELLQAVKGAVQMHLLAKENRRLNAVVQRQNEELTRWSQELEVIVQEQTMALRKSYDSLRVINAKLRTNFKNTIMAFAGLVELRDPRMRAHSRNVAEVCGLVAKELEMAREERETLIVAALLHDIGKIGIPDLMLRQDAEQMNYEVREEYIKHPLRGQAAVEIIEDLRPAGRIIRSHHERYDGTGFPDGLKRREIPPSALILALVDYIDVKNRRFGSTLSQELIRKEVELQAGSRFDPKLTTVVLAVAEKYYRKKRRFTEAVAVEVEVSPDELAVGMEVNRDVVSGTGILLLGKGKVLGKTSIELLRRYYKLDPPHQGIFVRRQ
jgi:response regulator RpfG family c-di-GMP phosphodiesterase